MPLAGLAQDVTEPALKAAFIYNFMKFTEWPEPVPASDPFVICVLGDSNVGDALERVVRDRQFAGRRMTVSIVAISEPKQSCRVLYVSGVTAIEGAQLLAGLQDSPVLTISDAVGFTEAGGMAQFFFERGQLRFNIGLEAVKRSRLQMSSRLLVLAKRYERS
jgi:hypothetical protein